MEIGQIVEEYQLTPSQVHSALAYYHDHKAQMDREIHELRQLGDKMFLEYQNSPLAEKLSKLGW